MFKGAALAHTHYAESWRRPALDADVLIAPESRDRVFADLRSAGLRAAPPSSRETWSCIRRRSSASITSASSTLLDIHWRIANPQVVSQVLTHDELVERSVTVRVQEHPMRVPSSVDALLIACVHRAAHHPDVEQPILDRRHSPAGQPSRTIRVAGVRSACGESIDSRVCLQGLKRAEALFQTALPLDVLTALVRTHVGAVGSLPAKRPAAGRSSGGGSARARAALPRRVSCASICCRPPTTCRRSTASPAGRGCRRITRPVC